jgi:predicted GIY-YIG superfamily endonuclease
MHAQPRLAPRELAKSDIPADPGVYAWYRDGSAIYVGKADSLQQRLWSNHLGRGRVMTGSALRRNVAQHLGIATANDIKTLAYQPADDEVQAVRDFIDGCEVAWLTCATKPAAVKLEAEMKREWQPPLTRA